MKLEKGLTEAIVFLERWYGPMEHIKTKETCLGELHHFRFGEHRILLDKTGICHGNDASGTD